MAAESIHGLVHGLTHAYVAAHFVCHNNVVKVWRTEVANKAPLNVEPGKILNINSDGMLFGLGIGAIGLCDITLEIDLNVGAYLGNFSLLRRIPIDRVLLRGVKPEARLP